MFFLLYGDQISEIAVLLHFQLIEVSFLGNLLLVQCFLFCVLFLNFFGKLIHNFEEWCTLDKTIIRYTPSVSQHK